MQDHEAVNWGTPMRHIAKIIARQIPAIDNLMKQRDDLLCEVAALRRRRDAAAAEREALFGAEPDHGRHLSRTDKLLTGIDRSMRILEIGASYNPTVPKAAGWHAFVVDHATQAELQQKYAELGPLAANIEPVDFVCRGGPVEDAIPDGLHGTFNACITSHVIEHVPDPISLFRSFDRLLAPDGIVSFAIPDKRFCFDFFRPLTMAPAWLEAFERRATRHSRRAILEMSAYNMNNGDRIAWGQEEAGMAPRLTSELAPAKSVSDSAGMADDSSYVDCHAWCFTPSSFELLFLELGALALIDFRIEHIFPTAGCEFFVTFRKGRPGLSAQGLQDRRLVLLRAMVDDLARQAACMNRCWEH